MTHPKYHLERLTNPLKQRMINRSSKKIFEEELKSRVQKEIRQVLKRVPITETDEGDVFIVGYPKSGNTWFQNLVAGIVYGVNPRFAPDSLIQELVPDVHYMKYYKRYRTPMFFKSHELPNPNYRRVVYLLRDGRDVMVSYYHYNKALIGDDFDFLSMVRDGRGLFPCKWYEHVNVWLKNPYGADMIIIKYEELHSNPMDALQKFCDFVGVNRDETFLRSVAENASFDKLRKKEIRFGLDNPAWPKEKPFFRRGQIGSWKDEMQQDILEIFLKESGEVLKQLEYLLTN